MSNNYNKNNGNHNNNNNNNNKNNINNTIPTRYHYVFIINKSIRPINHVLTQRAIFCVIVDLNEIANYMHLKLIYQNKKYFTSQLHAYDTLQLHCI